MGKEQHLGDNDYKQIQRFPEMPDGSTVSGASVLNQILDWIIPDGRVELPEGEIEQIEPSDLSHLSRVEQEALQVQLAHVLYRYVKDVHQAFDNPTQSKINDLAEPYLAFEFARYRHAPEFLHRVAGIVDEEIAANVASPPRTLYPRLS